MQIKVYATLRDLLGQARFDVPAQGGTTVREVLESLAAGHPAFESKLWNGKHELTGFVTILLNGRSIEYLKGLATPVSETDVIALFPPVGGG